MPPRPTPRPGAGSRSRQTAQVPPEGKGEGRATSVGPGPRSAKAAQRQVLETKLKRMYMMAGTAIQPFARWVPALRDVGGQLKLLSDEAAAAWMDLADEDPKVMEAIRSMTSASNWGNVVGIHFAIFASASPMAQMAGAMVATPPQSNGQPPQMSVDPTDALESLLSELSPEDRAQAESMAAAMSGVPLSPDVYEVTGGPGDTIRVPSSPQGPTGSTVPTPKPSAAIPTPEEMGARNLGTQDGIFPTDASPPSGK